MVCVLSTKAHWVGSTSSQYVGRHKTDGNLEIIDIACVNFHKDVVSSHHQLEGQAALVGEG